MYFFSFFGDVGSLSSTILKSASSLVICVVLVELPFAELALILFWSSVIFDIRLMILSGSSS